MAEAEKSGWLDKKGKRRWFVCKNGELFWFNGPKQAESGEKPNGSLNIRNCNIAQVGEVGGGKYTALVIMI